jgi:methionyl-tRNA synthetase
MRDSFAALAFSDGLDAWMRAVFACNQYVDDQAPWALRKTDPERMAGVLLTLLRCVRDLAIAVRPVVPASADKLLDQLGVAADARDYAALGQADWLDALIASGFRVAQPVGVFPRLEAPASEESAEDA